MTRMTQALQLQNANEEEVLSFFENILSALPDPRRRQGTRYPLRTVVVCALMSAVCGAEDAQGMEYWSAANEDWLSEILEMPHGVPTQDVFLSVFASLNPDKFAEAFMSWANLLSLRLTLQNETQVHPQIAIDGKTNRRSYNAATEQNAIHMVNAGLTDILPGVPMMKVKQWRIFHG